MYIQGARGVGKYQDGQGLKETKSPQKFERVYA